MHYHGALSWCIIMMHDHDALSWCIMHYHDAFMMHHDALSWCIIMMHYHDALSWCIDTPAQEEAVTVAVTMTPLPPGVAQQETGRQLTAASARSPHHARNRSRVRSIDHGRGQGNDRQWRTGHRGIGQRKNLSWLACGQPMPRPKLAARCPTAQLVSRLGF